MRSSGIKQDGLWKREVTDTSICAEFVCYFEGYKRRWTSQSFLQSFTALSLNPNGIVTYLDLKLSHVLEILILWFSIFIIFRLYITLILKNVKFRKRGWLKTSKTCLLCFVFPSAEHNTRLANEAVQGFLPPCLGTNLSVREPPVLPLHHILNRTAHYIGVQR